MDPSTRRLLLQSTLEAVLGTRNVYFQPPMNVQMQYPCIVYSRDSADVQFADNKPYRSAQRYQVTVIDRDPDSTIHQRIAFLPYCTYNRFFAADNLNHDVLTLFF